MKSRAFKIVLVYIIGGIIWLAVSDILFLATKAQPNLSIVYIGTTSALLFLAVTAIVLYRLINLHYSRLQQSEHQYRSYYEDNPIPMWIYSPKTLKFISVNNAAIENYGYTRDEFLNMSILDIRPKGDIPKVIKAVKNYSPAYKNWGVWNHKHKNGSDIFAQVTSHLILSSADEHIMIMAEDITKRIQTETRLKKLNDGLSKQNALLRDISWSQSHKVRRPLASILGLLNVIRISNNELEKELCINYIEISASELDIMIYDIAEQLSKAVYVEEDAKQNDLNLAVAN